MIITGERTVPGLWHENYWFRRHEVVYEWVTDLVAGRVVLEAGCGEGYGASLIDRHAKRTIALDYDGYAVGHVRAAYPDLEVIRGNLVDLPLPDACVDVVVSLQTIEHLWDQETFCDECLRVLRPGGTFVVSTPNRLTFPPGNPYHPRELTAGELRDLIAPRFSGVELFGLRHADRLRAWEDRHGSLVDAQIAGAFETWPETVAEAVRSVTTADFLLDASDPREALDLIARGLKPPVSPGSER